MCALPATGWVSKGSAGGFMTTDGNPTHIWVLAFLVEMPLQLVVLGSAKLHFWPVLEHHSGGIQLSQARWHISQGLLCRDPKPTNHGEQCKLDGGNCKHLSVFADGDPHPGHVDGGLGGLPICQGRCGQRGHRRRGA
eukprot:524242-Pelagomonas_calceolata.AAC.8